MSPVDNHQQETFFFMTETFKHGFMAKCAEAGLTEDQADKLLRKQAGLGSIVRGAVRALGRRPARTLAAAGAAGLGAAALAPGGHNAVLGAARGVIRNPFDSPVGRRAFPALSGLHDFYKAYPQEREGFRNGAAGMRRDLAIAAAAPADYAYNPVGEGRWDFSPAITNVAGRVIGNMPEQFRTPQMTNDMLNLVQAARAARDPGLRSGSGSFYTYRPRPAGAAGEAADRLARELMNSDPPANRDSSAIGAFLR